MPRQVNIAEAKAKLSELVEAASRGEEIVLARHGKPMARLSAIPAAARAVRRLGALRDRLSPADIKELIRSIEKPLSKSELAAQAGEASDEEGISIKSPRSRSSRSSR